MRCRWLQVLLASVLSSSALADAPIDSAGARIGGYGFREVASGARPMSPEHTGWNACRMNGVGVFATRNLTPHFFLEGGVDTYFTETFPTGESVGNYDTAIDRVSGLLTAAAGARLFPEAVVSPYIQAGLGAEATRVRLPQLGLEDTAILPMGFFGVGGNLRLGERVRVGASLRVNIMGYYDDAQFQTELSPQAELATQGQFFARYTL